MATDTPGNRSRDGARTRVRVPNPPTVVQAVADDIRKRVLDGEFPPGTQLRENDLLDDYGIARHGIRSALHSLAHEGLLRHQPHRGVFVPDADPEELADVLEARRILETGAVKTVVERGLPTERIINAVATLDELDPDASWSELLAADLAVHHAIVETVESDRLTRMHDALVAESALFLAFYGAKDQQRRIIPELHRKLVDAIVAGDADAAQELLTEDLKQGLHLATRSGDGAGPVGQPAEAATLSGLQRDGADGTPGS